MKKRILTFALTVIYLLSGISMSAFAEEREYVLLGSSIGLKNQKIDVQNKKVDAMQDNGKERFSIRNIATGISGCADTSLLGVR